MFYSRRINPETQKVEVWECEWSNKGTGMAKKNFLRKAGDEEDFDFHQTPMVLLMPCAGLPAEQ